MKVGLISCCSMKLKVKSKAKEIYISPLFKKSLKYSLQNYDQTFILSAKYGLLHLDDVIEPYDYTLLRMNDRERKEWSYKVYKQIETKIGLDNTFYFHTGLKYRQYLVRVLKSVVPLQTLENKSIGFQLKFYNDNTK